MSKIDRHGNVRKLSTEKEPQITLTLYSSSDNTHHRFTVPARMTVSDFLELALDRLAKGKGAERVEELRNNYAPVRNYHPLMAAANCPLTRACSKPECSLTPSAAYLRVHARNASCSAATPIIRDGCAYSN